MTPRRIPGALTQTATTYVVQGNNADAGFGTGAHGSESPNASGGGLYVVTGAVVTQDTFTLGDLVNNADSDNDPNDNFGSGGPI